MISREGSTLIMQNAKHAESSETFWERVYVAKTEPSSGRASSVLTRFVTGRTPGQALELGCARGDDAIWLARQGWTVTAVDVSPTAIRAATKAAAAAGLHERTRFAQQDLAETFPEGTYDLVTAMFLHSPVTFGRTKVLRRAAEAVAPGGMLLLAAHGSAAPWSWRGSNTGYPTAKAELADLVLDPKAWREVFVGSEPRIANGPNGARAEVLDAIVAIERL